MYKVIETNSYKDLIDKHHISSLAAKVMSARNIDLVSKIKEKNPYDYNGMDRVVGMILKAINDNKKIAIYGDYDVDGICAVSILYRTFKLLNYDVGYYVPNRYEDGYGLSSNIVMQMKEKGYSLLICVDNGIKAFKAIEDARNLNMDVIVLDHHQKDEEIPNFNLCLHPQYSLFSEYNMCGASICYYLSIALLAKEDEMCLALAGIATIGDVMPLIGQNKLLVSKSLKYLNSKKYKAINLLNEDNKPFDETLLSMKIVPKLNSIGRIYKSKIANSLVKFLVDEDESEMKNILKIIEKANFERRKMTEDGFAKLDKGNYDSKIIIEKSDDMLEGINGIIAARFLSKYNLPAIVFSLDESKAFYKGSARSINDLNIIEVLEKNEYIEVFGGHKGAAGITIKKENYDNFSNSIELSCSEYEYKEEIQEVIEVYEEELNYKAYGDLVKLGPFGEGNPKPLFILKDCDGNKINKSKDGKHILMSLSKDVSFVGFNLADKLDKTHEKYNLIFKMELNNMYPNKVSCICLDLEGIKNV